MVISEKNKWCSCEAQQDNRKDRRWVEMTDRQITINALKTTVGLFMAHDTITVSCNDYFTDMLKDSINLLEQQPEIVMCKDCKWWDKKDDSNYGYCHACKHGYYSDHWEIGIYRTYKGNWFCADGERK